MTEKILGGRPGGTMRWAFLEGFGIVRAWSAEVEKYRQADAEAMRERI